MSVGINRYQTDLREIHFVLEQFGLNDRLGKAPFEAWGPDEVKAVLAECYRFAKEELGPLNASADREGCRLEDGKVFAPKGFKEAWSKLYETGLWQMSMSEEFGGQGSPHLLFMAIEEILSGANPAFNMYPGLSHGAADLLKACATQEQKEKYIEKMTNGTWGGTMCLTEPHAGSDVGAAKSSAKKNADGTYSIKGTKIFISAGDHDLTENIIHLVLARIEGAPEGTKGLSLFLVPKRRIDADGNSGEPNDVQVASIEHKMGINGSSTCQLAFGDNDGCVGELVGGVEHAGMRQMFEMMNVARIAVGLQGLATLSAAYFNALEYARDRKQGAHFTQFKDPTAERVAIVQHPDVRRMLLEIKAYSEGIRALAGKLCGHEDQARVESGKDDEAFGYHQGQVELLTPLLKSFASDQAFRLCGQAIQVYGGAGYLKDHPVEQYARDAKIYSIYEGTNHIQAMDLVGRKMGQKGGANFQAFMGDVGKFLEQNKEHPKLAAELGQLASAQEAIMTAAMQLLGWSQDMAKVALIPLSANRYLNMMSELAVGWLLLDAAIIANEKLEGAKEGSEEAAFYEGKIASARWFARNVLPGIEAQGKMMALEDATPLEVSDEAFGPAA